MSIEMLQELAKQPLPRAFIAPADIDQIMLCQAMGYVDAQLPLKIRDGGPARVLRIKPEGYQALAIYYREKIRESGFGGL